MSAEFSCFTPRDCKRPKWNKPSSTHRSSPVALSQGVLKRTKRVHWWRALTRVYDVPFWYLPTFVCDRAREGEWERGWGQRRRLRERERERNERKKGSCESSLRKWLGRGQISHSLGLTVLFSLRVRWWLGIGDGRGYRVAFSSGGRLRFVCRPVVGQHIRGWLFWTLWKEKRGEFRIMSGSTEHEDREDAGSVTNGRKWKTGSRKSEYSLKLPEICGTRSGSSFVMFS